MTVTKNINSIHIDATGQAHTGPGKLKRVVLYSGTAGGVTAKCYDGTADTDNEITPTLAVDPASAAESGEEKISKSLEIGAEFATGVYVVIAGTGEALLVLD